MNCPHCGKNINIGKLIGSRKSAAKSRAARENGKRGGRPKKDTLIKQPSPTGISGGM